MTTYLVIGGIIFGLMAYYGKFTFRVEIKNNLNKGEDINK